MSPEDGKETVLKKLKVSRADIAAAKRFIVNTTERSASDLLVQWIRSNEAGCPNPLVLKGEDVDHNLHKAAKFLSLKLAGAYALWELISTGFLMPAGDICEESPTIQYTTVLPGTGGHSGGWDFDRLKFSYPIRIYRPVEVAKKSVFTDGDLYLEELSLVDLHPGIEEALREAVRCFRYDLFTGTVAMLGAASEGVWFELGRALLNACPNSSKSRKIEKALDGSSRGIGYLVKQIIEICEDRSETGELLRQANKTLEELRSAALWWDTVREARNVLHWEVDATFGNDFDKVSVLMVSAASHLRTLWKIRMSSLNSTDSN